MPAFDLHLNFRGPLSSCNYDCDYCPFAKHVSSREELAADRLALARFVDWCERHQYIGDQLHQRAADADHHDGAELRVPARGEH